jgi:hypothetical protein
MAHGGERAVIYLVIFGVGIVVSVVKFALRASKGRDGDRALEDGHLDRALASYREQLLGVLELGPGSMNKDDPKVFLSDCREEGMEVLAKIKAAHVKAGGSFNDAPYHQLAARVEALIKNRDNFGFTNKLKGPAKKTFQAIREDFKNYIKNGMSAESHLPRQERVRPPVSSSVSKREPEPSLPKSQPMNSHASYKPAVSMPSSGQQTSRWSLSLYVDGRHISNHPLRVGNYTVGREKGADIYVEDSMVSRKHLSIRVDNLGRVEVRDVGSSNGTWKHGRERIVCDSPIHGCWYQMGKAQLLFQHDGVGDNCFQ